MFLDLKWFSISSWFRTFTIAITLPCKWVLIEAIVRTRVHESELFRSGYADSPSRNSSSPLSSKKAGIIFTFEVTALIAHSPFVSDYRRPREQADKPEDHPAAELYEQVHICFC